MQVESQLVFKILRRVSSKTQLEDWASCPVCLDKPVTELTWYLLHTLLFSRPFAEEVLTSLSSQSWA